VTGPWERGPVEIVREGAVARLVNRVETPVAVTEVRAWGEGGLLGAVAVEAELAPGEAREVALPAGTVEAHPVLPDVRGAHAALTERRIFAQDVRTNVVFVNQVNYAAQGVRRLDVRARLRGLPEEHEVRWRSAEGAEQPAVGEIALVLPLGEYLARRVLEIDVRRTPVEGEPVQTGWREIGDLLERGNVVSLTSELIQ
jgi:hypothetical protein